MDLLNTSVVKQSISPRLVTGTVNGTGVDTAGHARALFRLDLGTITGTTPTVTLRMQESADNSAFTDVATADLIGGAQLAAIDGTTDDNVYAREYAGNKRYLRWACTAVSGTSPSLPTAATVVLGQSLKQPSA